MIWRFCMPHRVVEWPNPVHEDIPEARKPVTPCEITITSRLNNRLPLLSRVCRTSRSIVFETGDRDWFPTLRSPLPDSHMPWGRPWKDRARDSIHVTWTPGAIRVRVRCDNPFPDPVWAWQPLGGVPSLMLDQVAAKSSVAAYARHDFSHSPPTEQPRPYTSMLLKALQLMPKWLVVMQTIIVHCDLRTAAATGLFGLSGDATVLVVDVVEKKTKIDKLFDLIETCGGREGPIVRFQNLHREPPEEMRRKLRFYVVDGFHSETLAAAMHPAIMFRLCPQWCDRLNEAGQEARMRARYGANDLY